MQTKHTVLALSSQPQQPRLEITRSSLLLLWQTPSIFFILDSVRRSIVRQSLHWISTSRRWMSLKSLCISTQSWVVKMYFSQGFVPPAQTPSLDYDSGSRKSTISASVCPPKVPRENKHKSRPSSNSIFCSVPFGTDQHEYYHSTFLYIHHEKLHIIGWGK